MTESDSGPPSISSLPLGEPQNKKPSLVINVYSWWTLVVGLLMLAVGLVGGYYLRPVITEGEVAQAGLVSVGSSDSGTPTIPTVTIDPTEVAASREEMMAFLVENTRHFKGDPNAEITILEFSDFQ